MSIKAAIFDLDGTLLNTYEDLANAVNFALRKKSFPEHEAECYKMFAGNGTNMMIKRALPEEFRNDQTVEELKPFYLEYYNKHTGEKTRPYDGIIELIDKLKSKGIKLAVASNKIDCMVKQVVEEYFNGYFDFATGQKEGKRCKPHPDMVLEAIEALGVSKDEVIYSGDSGVDAETGKNAGIFTVGVLWGFRDADELKKGGVDVLIEHPSELLKYIEG